MRLTTRKILFLTSLFLFLSLSVFPQTKKTESVKTEPAKTEPVALVPFWGPDEKFIKEFGEELYKGVNNLQGYKSVIIDMTKLPDDVPAGGFPPYICPSPSLIKTNPIAITGELIADPEDEEFWHLRLYLWEMADTRLVFSDELTAYDRQECAAALPGMLEWLFSWLKKGKEAASTVAGGVYTPTSMPYHWMYVGARAGWIPLRMQTFPSWDDSVNPSTYKTYIFNEFRSVSGAISYSMALFPEYISFFSRFAVQAEGIFIFDFPTKTPIYRPNFTQTTTTMTILPTLLLKYQMYRQGNMLFTLFGGGYTWFTLNPDEVGYRSKGIKIPLGVTGGVTFGGKLDPLPGIFFIDLRYSMDFFDTIMKKDGEGFRRRDVTISIGYEYGFITKK